MASIFIHLLLLVLASLTQAQHVVNTTSGRFRGFSPYPGVTSYLGIPYAAPPVGPLRWRPPQPYTPDPEADINNATEWYSGCYQVLFNTALNDKVTGTRESEDCLFLSVWMPADHDPDAAEKLPVLIWIYGGGFAQGASNPNDGIDFVARQKDIIVVSFNYRVNIFGFPTTPAVERKNVGLLDQRFAIEWIAENIEAFGGDPSRMVAAGQSAGSISVAMYAFAYPDDPIVSGLVTMSGQPETNLRDDGGAWRQVAERTDCADRNRTAELECLRGVEPRDLKRGISLSNIIEYGDLTGGSPTVDNMTLFAPEEYVQRGMEGRFAQIVSIIPSRREQTLTRSQPIWASHARYEGDNAVPWNASAEQGINYTASDFATLAAFHCPTMLATMYRVMSNVTTYRNVWSGDFRAITPYPWMRGAYHAADVYLMFGGADATAYEDYGARLQNAYEYHQDAMGRFVRDPKEGLAGLGWPKYDATGRTLVDMFPSEGSDVIALMNATAFDEPCQQLFAQFSTPP